MIDVVALIERLSRGFADAGEHAVVVDKADLRTALTLLKNEDKWRRQAIRFARAIALEDAARVCERLRSSGENTDSWTITRDMAFRNCVDAIRALTPGPGPSP